MSNEELQRKLESGKLVAVKRWVAYTTILGFIGGILFWLFTVIFWITGIDNAIANQEKTNNSFDKRISRVEAQNDQLDDNQKLIITNLRAYIESHGGRWQTNEVK